MAVRNEGTDGDIAASDVATPLGPVRRDLEGLIRRVGQLQGDLRGAQLEARRELQGVLLEALEVLDAFDRVFANIEPREATADRQARIWVGNFRSVRRVLEVQLKARGVVRMDAPEGKALPGYHTIVETRPAPDADDGTILEEHRRGYLWRGDVLRKAEVIVVKN